MVLRAKNGQWSHNRVGVLGWLQIGGIYHTHARFKLSKLFNVHFAISTSPFQEMAAYVQRDREDFDRRDEVSE
jgi:hypothetical protein